MTQNAMYQTHYYQECKNEIVSVLCICFRYLLLVMKIFQIIKIFLSSPELASKVDSNQEEETAVEEGSGEEAAKRGILRCSSFESIICYLSLSCISHLRLNRM